MTIKEIQEEIIDEFDLFEDWMERYEHLIDLGKSLPLIEERFKMDENLIKGCQSKVWLHAEIENDQLAFSADSDAILTKGIVALLLRVFNGQKPSDIIHTEMDFIDKIGLKEHLSATRANGLLSMIKQIKLYALGFHAKMS